MKKLFLYTQVVVFAMLMFACNGAKQSNDSVAETEKCPVLGDLFVELSRVDVIVPFEANGKWGYLYEDGDTAVFPVYDTVTAFVDDSAMVVYEGVRYSVSRDENYLAGVPVVFDKVNN